MWTCLVVIFGAISPPVLGSSPWSLIQAKTSVHSNTAAVSSMDEALAFVQGLAEKVVGHDVPLSESEKTAVDTIQAYVKRMLEDIKKQRNEDQNEVKRYRDVVQSCADVAQASLDDEVKRLWYETKQAREQHETCREEEATSHEATSAECLKYDTYRTTRPGRVVPKCMNGLKTSHVKSTDPATKKDMEQCITEINAWVVPLYDLYLKCKRAQDVHLGVTKGCDVKQDTFEGAFCQYADLLWWTCEEQTKCRAKNIKIMEEGDEEVGVAEKARQADCEVGHKLDCLLKIFEETDNKKKPGMLEECKKLKPTCPDKISYPPTPGPTRCDKLDHEPCDDAWTEEYYTSKPWYSSAPTTACHACHPPHPCSVALYDHDFAGWKAIFGPGEYETRALIRGGAKDDEVSSIIVEAGCIVSLYPNPDFTGDAAVFTEGYWEGSEFVKKFPNNSVSSMIVEEPSNVESEAPCVFPTRYYGIEVSECATADHWEAWCYINEEGTEWRNCVEADNACYFPFYHNDIKYLNCTADDSEKPWCFLVGGGWKFC